MKMGIVAMKMGPETMKMGPNQNPFSWSIYGFYYNSKISNGENCLLLLTTTTVVHENGHFLHDNHRAFNLPAPMMLTTYAIMSCSSGFFSNHDYTIIYHRCYRKHIRSSMHNRINAYIEMVTV